MTAEQEDMGTRFFARAEVRAFIAMSVCLALWVTLSAPRLLRNAKASAEGTRRTLAVALLEPFAGFSEASGLAVATEALEGAVGKRADELPGGDLDLEIELAGEDLPPIPDEAFPPAPPRLRRPTKQNDRNKDDPLRAPSRKVRLRIAIIGDSIADGVGDAVSRGTDGDFIHVLSLGRIATGLARADYFDWVAGMTKVESRYTPDVVVILLGGNDKQSVVFPGGRAVISGDKDWGAAYKERIGDLLDATRARTHVIWVGLPPVRDRGKSRLFRVYNSMYRDIIDERRNSVYLDIWELFDDADGDYRPYGRGPNGKITLLRARDGADMTAAGYDMIFNALARILTDEWKLPRRYIN